MKIFKYTVLAIFLGCLVASAITLWKLYSIAQTLPPVEQITSYRFNEPSMVYDVNNRVIAELGNERRYPIQIDEMPLQIRQAVIAVEDARFYEHNGIDLIGISRAVVTNIKSGRFAEGGSTLTQQLTKNIFFSPEKKLIRKYKEAVLAYRIDNYLTKDEILEFYLNFVNFGRGGYGVQAASVNYFGKNASDMTLAECALLAGIPKAPAIYAPHISYEKAFDRRNYVLLRMHENGFINEEQYLTAIEEPIVITDTVPLRLRHAGYFLDYVLKYLSDELGISEPQNQGLKVYTTLNVDYQASAEAAIRSNLRENTKRQGYFGRVGSINIALDNDTTLAMTGDGTEILAEPKSLLSVPSYLSAMGYKKAIVKDIDDEKLTISLDNGTAGVVMLIDSRWASPVSTEKNRPQLSDFRTILAVNDIIYVTHKQDDRYLLEQDPPMESALLALDPQTGAILAMVGGFAFEKSMFNRAVQAKRQVGSVFKPLVYSVALETGQQVMSKVLDAPILSTPDDNGMTWRPKNFEDRYYGVTTLKEGLTRSRNIVTIRVSERVGLKRILNYAKLFGITSELQSDLSVTIGSGSISLQEMVYAYTTFPNMGKRPSSPYFVTKVEDSDGNILFEIAPPEHVDVIKPKTAQIMTDLLINVVEQGTGARAKAIHRPVGVKTGTTNENRDTWFVGFLPNLVVGVWVGFDEFKTGMAAAGAQSAGPAWVEFVNAVVPTLPLAVFPVAEDVLYQRVNLDTMEPTNDFIGENISFEPYSIEPPPPVDDNATDTPPISAGVTTTEQ
ncbi:MAG: PBP1A family penicillin-binding protein [Deferribacteraceae bacterium]|nr:PBP1A family penicillin-binding protein [Deferribacteraceae bacterium]